MYIKKIKLKASEKVRLESMLTKSPAKYPIRLSTVKPFFIDKCVTLKFNLSKLKGKWRLPEIKNNKRTFSFIVGA